MLKMFCEQFEMKTLGFSGQLYQETTKSRGSLNVIHTSECSKKQQQPLNKISASIINVATIQVFSNFSSMDNITPPSILSISSLPPEPEVDKTSKIPIVGGAVGAVLAVLTVATILIALLLLKWKKAQTSKYAKEGSRGIDNEIYEEGNEMRYHHLCFSEETILVSSSQLTRFNIQIDFCIIKHKLFK